MLKVNADDYGRDFATSRSIIDCFREGRIDSASFMVFMEDSARAAEAAEAEHLPLGLHLNYTEPYSEKNMIQRQSGDQKKVIQYLKDRKYNQLLYSPRLKKSFRSVTENQIREFHRLCQKSPLHVDGHNHMHLCANVFFDRLIERGTVLRRNFTFTPKEKSALNRFYRYAYDWLLGKQYEISEYFFSIELLDRKRLEEVVILSEKHSVELEVHPSRPEEFSFLMSDEWRRLRRL